MCVCQKFTKKSMDTNDAHRFIEFATFKTSKSVRSSPNETKSNQLFCFLLFLIKLGGEMSKRFPGKLST